MKIGIDFGTTNSSVAVARDGVVETASFAYSGGVSESFRSVLYLEQVRQAGGLTGVKSWGGSQAIDQYLAAETKGRLIQSLKSFLSSRLFQKTEILRRMYTLEDLIARILREITGIFLQRIVLVLGARRMRRDLGLLYSRSHCHHCGRRARRRVGRLRSLHSGRDRKCNAYAAAARLSAVVPGRND